MWKKTIGEKIKAVLCACFIANIIMAVLSWNAGDIGRVVWHCLLGVLSVVAFVNE
jgi:hypothetical protein